MRRLLSFILLFVCLTVRSQTLSVTNVTVGTLRLKNNYIINEQFEATGYDVTGWIASGSTAPDPDYTGVVIKGAQSLRLRDTGTDPKITNNFPASSTVWVSVKFRLISALSGTRDCPLLFYDAAGAKPFQIRLDGDGATARFVIVNGTSSAVNGTLGEVGVGTNYTIWVRYVMGTGANGITDLYSATGTSPVRPTTPMYSKTDGNATTKAQAVAIFGEVPEVIIDDFRLRIDGDSIDD